MPDLEETLNKQSFEREVECLSPRLMDYAKVHSISVETDVSGLPGKEGLALRKNSAWLAIWPVAPDSLGTPGKVERCWALRIRTNLDTAELYLARSIHGWFAQNSEKPLPRPSVGTQVGGPSSLTLAWGWEPVEDLFGYVKPLLERVFASRATN